jgi:hypothetical protein
MVVKARTVMLLEKLSDFPSLQNDVKAQDRLVNGIINLYAQQKHDVYMQMRCLEYLKNFYNNHLFKV